MDKFPAAIQTVWRREPDKRRTRRLRTERYSELGFWKNRAITAAEPGVTRP
jgi:hypothetical protein